MSTSDHVERYNIRVRADLAYTPGRLLDHLMEVLGCKTDVALWRELGVARSTISKTRNKLITITPTMIIMAMEITGMSLHDVRELAGMPRFDEDGYHMHDHQQESR